MRCRVWGGFWVSEKLLGWSMGVGELEMLFGGVQRVGRSLRYSVAVREDVAEYVTEGETLWCDREVEIWFSKRWDDVGGG